MMHSTIIGLATLATLSACLPITKREFHRDTQLKLYDHEEERGNRTYLAEVSPNPTTLDVAVTSVASCEVEKRRVVRRHTKIEKTTNKFVHGSLYLVGVGGLGLAGFVLYDNLSVDDPVNRAFPIGSTLEDGQYAGIGISAAAGLLLMIALGSSASAVDYVAPSATVEIPIKRASKLAECGRKAGAGVYVGLVFSTGGVARVYVPIGKTDAAGRVAVSWATVQSQLPSNARPEANLVAGAPEKIGVALMQHGPVDALATVVVPASADPGWERWTRAWRPLFGCVTRSTSSG